MHPEANRGKQVISSNCCVRAQLLPCDENSGSSIPVHAAHPYPCNPDPYLDFADPFLLLDLPGASCPSSSWRPRFINVAYLPTRCAREMCDLSSIFQEQCSVLTSRPSSLSCCDSSARLRKPTTCIFKARASLAQA